MERDELNGRDIILTGLPRSGTTLTCHLLDKLPDTVALHEPMEVRRFATLPTHTAVCDEVGKFFVDMRHSILLHRTAITKHIGGKIPDNHVANHYADSQLRPTIESNSPIVIEKELSPDFMLIIKHPAAFTATLGTLIKHFPCYAVIRNPLSVLTSWNSVALPVQDGRTPAAESLDGDLKHALTFINDRLERQLYILSWFFERYERYLPDESIIRYEKIVETGGKNLRVVTEKAATLNEPLENKNKNRIYKQETMQRLGEKLLKSSGAYWQFYEKKQVEELIDVDPPRHNRKLSGHYTGS